MIILDATTKSLEVVLSGAPATTQLVYTADFVDVTVNNYTPGSSDGLTNSGTAVTVVAAPAASTQRQVKLLTVHNQDTAAAIVTVQVNNASTIRKIAKVTLAVGSTLVYTDGEGFRVIDTSGGILSNAFFSLPITAAANDVVLVDSSVNPLIALDAAEVLTLAPFNVGAAGPFASDGMIRGAYDFSLFIRNANDDDDISFLASDGNDGVIVGSDTATKAVLKCADTNVTLVPGLLTFHADQGSQLVEMEASVSGSPSYLAFIVRDAGAATNGIQLEGPADANAFFPGTGTPDLGIAAKPWKDGYFSGFLSTVEMTAPSAPAANGVRVYAQDNGAGKTQLMALFSSGAAQQIAIQP